MLNRRNFLLNLFAGYLIVNKNYTVFSHDDASVKRDKKLYKFIWKQMSVEYIPFDNR